MYPVFQSLSIEDGTLSDWQDYRQYEQHFEASSLIPNPQNPLSSIPGEEVFGDLLRFRLMVGEHDDSLFIYLRVLDEHVVYRSRDGLRVDRSDSGQLSLMNRDGLFERYVIAPYDDRVVYPFRIGTDIVDFPRLSTSLASLGAGA